MTNRVIQRATLAVSLFGFAATVLAELKVNDNFSVSGYLEGSYQYAQPKPGPSFDAFNIDTSQLLFTANFEPVMGVLSFYYVPNAAQDTVILDAYVTFDVGKGLSITGGKFLSYLGFESFYSVNNPEISLANGDFLAPIPGYHEGVRVDYVQKTWSFGVGIMDSVYSGPHYLKGDGELRHNAGFEAYVKYVGLENLIAWFGGGYDTKGGFQIHLVATLDLWAQYSFTKATALAAEITTKDGGERNRGYNWLLLLTHALDEKFSLAGRVSGEEVRDGGPRFFKYTCAPAYALTGNLTVRAEFSYYDYHRYVKSCSTFAGVQAYFKF